MKIKFLIFGLALSPLLAFAELCKTTQIINAEAYAAKIGANKVTFLAVDLKTDKCHVIDAEGLDKRHGPFSTFKIPHTLIALETGAAKSIDEKIVWNPVKRPAKDFWPSTWKANHTLTTAFKHSTAWYYQELAQRISPAQYETWLARFSYGNQAFTPGSDGFWLNGELKISPREQVEFLYCLIKNGCGVKAATLNAFEKIALQETHNSKSLYAKTGAGPIDPNNNDGAFEGWYMGYIKDNRKPVSAFAIYVESESFSAIKNFRRTFALQLLSDLGCWVN
nr:transpeptidase [uncultured bacterium]AMP57389.1 transpeptidase [uncultured bacterium]